MTGEPVNLPSLKGGFLGLLPGLSDDFLGHLIGLNGDFLGLLPGLNGNPIHAKGNDCSLANNVALLCLIHLITELYASTSSSNLEHI